MRSPEIFVCSDPHFGHANILNHCDRPFSSVEEMDEELISRWNATVPSRNSVVYVVGDWAFKDHAKYIRRLNGSKVLVKGNHDDMPRESQSLFAGIHDVLFIRYYGFLIYMSHYAPRTTPAFSKKNCMHLYGHSHGRLPEGTIPAWDVGVDVWDFRPIPFDSLVAKLNHIRDLPRVFPEFQEDTGNISALREFNLTFLR